MMKKWFESKTVWLGILTTLSGVALLAAEFVADGKLASLEGWLLFSSGVAGVVIRIWFTNEPIE